jgi:predicted transcriptional regulator
MTPLVRTQLLLRDDQRMELDKIADQTNRSFSEIVRQFIDEQLRLRKYRQMEQAAELLAADYQAGGSLEMKDLDAEDFLDT